MLYGAVWSAIGHTYVPAGVRVSLPHRRRSILHRHDFQMVDEEEEEEMHATYKNSQPKGGYPWKGRPTTNLPKNVMDMQAGQYTHNDHCTVCLL